LKLKGKIKDDDKYKIEGEVRITVTSE